MGELKTAAVFLLLAGCGGAGANEAGAESSGESTSAETDASAGESSSESTSAETDTGTDTDLDCEPEPFVPVDAIAFYDFEGDGATVIDRTGNGHDGALSGATASRVAGRYCAGLASDGAEDGAVVPDHDAFDLVDGYTLEMWVRLPAQVASPRIHKNSTFTLRASYDSTLAYLQHENCIKTMGATLTYDPQRWYHIAGTWDGATFLYYIDAAEVSTQDCAEPPVLNDMPLWIGQGFGPSVIDDVAIFAGARSAEQICVDSRGSWTGASCSWEG